MCAVLDPSGTLCSLLIPEYSGNYFFNMVISTLFLLVNHTVKVIIYNSLSLLNMDHLCFVSLEF